MIQETGGLLLLLLLLPLPLPLPLPFPSLDIIQVSHQPVPVVSGTSGISGFVPGVSGVTEVLVAGV
ncbi:MAG: hypothetical protein CVU92_06660 [Firmicutes bacterium HGW-Firmicutes-17]|nr:MAG: hypothetical protein CVU92_06660 [Firmicutes bacterium HGW-Firmicutes-17]